MGDRADVLILEDNPTELEEIATVTQGCGMATIGTRSPAQAIRLLREFDPLFAVVDWDMKLGPDAERTAEGVLRVLAREHPDTYTIVYAINAGGDLGLQERIAAAHPAAIPHDKRQGLPSLLRRLRQLLQRQVGDLRIDRGSVVHLPTKTRFKHKVAVRLLRDHPRAVYAERMTAAYQALYRFMVWLDDAESTVSVVAEGNGFYHLEVTDKPDRPRVNVTGRAARANATRRR
jgi:CheY-like chemotaxis protein